MAVKNKSRLKRSGEIRGQGKVSVSKKSPTIQKRGSKNLGKTIHEQLGSLTKIEKEKIEERIDRLASFPELYPGPIVELDLMGQVQYLNPSAENLLPDLKSKGPNHPWIADFEELAALVQRDPNKSHLREKRVGHFWYQQVIYYAPEWKRIRIYGYDVTHQRRAEDLVSQSEERYRKLFEDDLTGDFFATSEGTVLDCNPSFIKMFGFHSREEALNANFLDLYPSHTQREVFMNRLGEKGKLEFYECVLLRRDGTFINVVENIVGHFDEQGSLRQFKGYLFDNTEHKRAEEKLKESEKKYRELYEGSQDGFVVVDMDGTIKEFNSAYSEMLGYSEAELTGVTYFALTPEKWHSMEAEIVKKQVLVRGYSDVYEKEYRKKNGIIFPISLRTYLVEDADGNPQGMWAFVRDITKRKEMEENLRRTRDELEIRVQERTAELRKAYEELEEQSKHLESFFRYNITPFVLLDKDFNFIRVNEAYAKACQRDVLDFPGHNHFEFYPHEENEAIFRRVVETKVPFQVFEKPFAFADHAERGVTYWDWTLTPLLDENGEVEFLVFSLEDVTDRKRAEQNVLENEQHLRVALATTNIAVFNQDRKLHYTWIYQSQLGYSVEQVIGKTDSELLPPGDAQGLMEIKRRVIESGRGTREEVCVTQNDRNLYYDLALEPIFDSAGTVVGLTGAALDITQRKKGQEALREQAMLLDLAYDAIFVRDMEGKIRFWNRGAEEMYGWKKEEAMGRVAHELLHTQYPSPLDEIITETIHKDRWEGELVHVGKDGNRIVVASRWAFQRDSKGNSMGILEINSDITGRKKAEEAAEAERLRFNEVLEMLPAYLVLLTPDYHVSFANRFFRERFGESHGRRCFEYLFGRSEPCEVCETYTVLKTMASHHWEWTGPDGRNYDVLDFPFTDTDGSPLIMEMGIDITERKRAEHSLTEREALLRTVFETLPVGVWITDRNGVIIQGNPAGRQIWEGARYVGIDQFAQYKAWWVDTGKPIEREEWAAARAVLKGETSVDEEIEIECFDGSHKIILNSAVPIRGEKQEILGAFIVNQDITERKRAEKAIRQMQKLEALGTLAGGIAHDFNNILMPIVINTELALLDTPEGSPISNCLKLVQEAANRGKDLIKQIITFSRQKEQVKAPVEIGPIIKEALKFLRSSIPKNIEIREHVEPESSMTFADPTQIHQILMNLCSNAAYAMREKGGILDVSLTAVEVDTDMARRHMELNPGAYLRLTVSDTGHGMDKEIMEKAFDPFFTTKKAGEGAGMGLAVVHGIVKNHGGAITVYSEVGKGSTFNVFLPMIKEELKTETAPSETIISGEERILLIDDEDIQIRSVQPMLERLGYRVIGKTDAIQALEIFRTQPDTFDLVITDQTMPHMTGRELVEQILRIRPDIPIILCTGFSEVIHEEEAKAMGIREFVMKPFSANEMAERIRKALGRNI